MALIESRVSSRKIEFRTPQSVSTKAALQRLVFFTVGVMALPVIVSFGRLQDNPLALINYLIHRNIWEDSSYCMDFGWNAFQAGRPVYESVLFAGVAKFQYPISSLLLYKLAALLHTTGYLLIRRLVLVSFVATLLLSCELFFAALPSALPSKENLTLSQRMLVRVCILALGLVFYPVVCGAALGQLQTFQVLLWTVVVLLWMRGQPELSGVCLAVICMLKPQFVVFLLWAAMRRRWRFFFAFLLSFLVIQAISVVAFGWHNEIEYVAVLMQLSRHGESYYANQSVNGLLQRMIGTADPTHFDLYGFAPFNRAIYIATTVSSGLLLAVGLFLPMLRRWRDSNLDLLFFGLIATVASPIAWNHHYGYFFAAAVYMMASYLYQKRRVPLLFQLSFIVLTIPVGAGLVLVGTRLTLLASFEFYAGLAMLCSLALLADGVSQTQELGTVEPVVTGAAAVSIPV